MKTSTEFKPMKTVFFDGGCKPNPGIMEVCVYCDGVSNHQKDIGIGTNNQAEWLSFILALETAKAFSFKDVRILGDSMLVVNQANERWKINNKDLKPFFEEFKILKKDFSNLIIEYIPREKNRAGMVIEGLLA